MAPPLDPDEFPLTVQLINARFVCDAQMAPPLPSQAPPVPLLSVRWSSVSVPLTAGLALRMPKELLAPNGRWIVTPPLALASIVRLASLICNVLATASASVIV